MEISVLYFCIFNWDPFMLSDSHIWCIMKVSVYSIEVSAVCSFWSVLLFDIISYLTVMLVSGLLECIISISSIIPTSTNDFIVSCYDSYECCIGIYQLLYKLYRNICSLELWSLSSIDIISCLTVMLYVVYLNLFLAISPVLYICVLWVTWY